MSSKKFIPGTKIEDLTGIVFGKITVLEFDHYEKGQSYWKVRCSCGTIFMVNSSKIKSTKNCCMNPIHKKDISTKTEITGISGHYIPDTYIKDLSGGSIGELKIIKYKYSSSRGTAYWEVLCSCGEIKVLTKYQIIKMQNCGVRHGWKYPAYKYHVLRYYKVNAEKENRSFNLTNEEFFSIVKGSCYYCGDTNPQISYNHNHTEKFEYCGIDRIDNTQGYTIENSRTCCNVCNWMKSDYIENDYFRHLEKIIRNWNMCGPKKIKTIKKITESNEYDNYKKSNTKRRKLEFNISEQNFYDIKSNYCFYCGSEKSYGKKGKGKEQLNGIDRVDSTQGYILENLVACCTVCNTMKSNYTLQRFIDCILNTYKLHKNKFNELF